MIARRRIGWMWLGFGCVAVLASCSDSDSPTAGSSNVVTSATTSPATTEPAPTTTASPSTTGASSASTSEAPTSTAPAATPAPTTTAAPAAATAPLVVLWPSGAVALHDPVTGEIQNVVATYQPEAVFVTSMTRAVDGTIVYDLAVEDSWYACDTSQGLIEAITADGAFQSVASGSGVDLSPDGASVVYVRSSGCEPDPDEPMFVVVNTDTVVVRGLADGTEQSWTFPGAVYTADADHVIGRTIWSGASLITTSDGRLVTIDPARPDLPDVAAAPQIRLSSGDPRMVSLVGAAAAGTVVAMAWDDSGLCRIITLDPATGAEVAELAARGAWSAVATDPTGAHWVGLRDGVVIVDGADLTLQRPDPSVDDQPLALGW
ncbi:MAG: hypothetical protein HZB15_18250 [Actinobacteria bacterium]|nr:hypothetical protein [Actinomycetota bacterium]